MAVVPDGLVVSEKGRTMHLAKVRHWQGVGGVSGPPNASTLCGRLLWEVYDYPLEDEATLPWPLCKACEAKR